MEQVNEEVYYLYLISTGEKFKYDTYDKAIVSAKDEKTARMFHPNPERGLMTEEAWIAHKELYADDESISSDDESISSDEENISSGKKEIKKCTRDYDGWVNDYNLVKVELIGLSYKKETCVIVASFNAG